MGVKLHWNGLWASFLLLRCRAAVSLQGSRAIGGETVSLLIALFLTDMNALSKHIYLYRYLGYTAQFGLCWSWSIKKKSWGFLPIHLVLIVSGVLQKMEKNSYFYLFSEVFGSHLPLGLHGTYIFVCLILSEKLGDSVFVFCVHEVQRSTVEGI